MVCVSVLYLDTARLGQACPAALRAQLDASRLSADDPSMYSRRFFQEGSRVWSSAQLRKYPAFESWKGVAALKNSVAAQFGAHSGHDVFLANRSAQLVRLAARVMFRTCRNVLASDLNWPQWQMVVADEAVRSGQRITVASVRRPVLSGTLSEVELAQRLETVFRECRCDGVFLPAVSNLGVRLPLSALFSRLAAAGLLRFTLVDAAQSFCQLPEPSPVPQADLSISGCHKWLGGFLPLGLAVCGRPLVAEQIRTILGSPAASSGIDDPLLHFTQRLSERVDNDSSETVSVSPLFSANAAIFSMQSSDHKLDQQLARQLENRRAIERSAIGTRWRIVETSPSLRSGILLMRSDSHKVQAWQSDRLRATFHRDDVVLSAYRGGFIRISVPTETLSRSSTDTWAEVLADVA